MGESARNLEVQLKVLKKDVLKICEACDRYKPACRYFKRFVCFVGDSKFDYKIYDGSVKDYVYYSILCPKLRSEFELGKCGIVYNAHLKQEDPFYEKLFLKKNVKGELFQGNLLPYNNEAVEDSRENADVVEKEWLTKEEKVLQETQKEVCQKTLQSNETIDASALGRESLEVLLLYQGKDLFSLSELEQSVLENIFKGLSENVEILTFDGDLTPCGIDFLTSEESPVRYIYEKDTLLMVKNQKIDGISIKYNRRSKALKKCILNSWADIKAKIRQRVNFKYGFFGCVKVLSDKLTAQPKQHIVPMTEPKISEYDGIKTYFLSPDKKIIGEELVKDAELVKG